VDLRLFFRTRPCERVPIRPANKIKAYRKIDEKNRAVLSIGIYATALIWGACSGSRLLFILKKTIFWRGRPFLIQRPYTRSYTRPYTRPYTRIILQNNGELIVEAKVEPLW
jgi:type I site-specific restriction-modification system R (restriction) subunit